MKNFLFSIFVIFILLNTPIACADTINKDASVIVRNMFTNFAEAKNITKLDDYYTKNFLLISNGTPYTYDEYKEMQTVIFQNLQSLTVVKYIDIFSNSHITVVFAAIKLVQADKITHTFYVLIVAHTSNNKISRLWEITYPTWKDKLKTQ